MAHRTVRCQAGHIRVVLKDMGASADIRRALQPMDRAHEEITDVAVSQPLLVRDKDPILFVGLTDVTESVWDAGIDSRDATAINPTLLPAFSTTSRLSVEAKTRASSEVRQGWPAGTACVDDRPRSSIQS